MKQKSFTQLGECFRTFIPKRHLCPTESGALSRRRIFSKENAFWAFFSQVLDGDGGCQEVVRKLQAFAAMKSKRLPSSSTAGYCQARKNLDLPGLEAILQHTSNQLQIEAEPDRGRMNGRRVVVVDGTGVSMPDTAENQPPISVFTGYQYGHLAFSTTSPFSWFPASYQSIVEFDDIREAVERIPIPHRGSQYAQYPISTAPTHVNEL